MEVVNLKAAITFRVQLAPEQKPVAWSTKTFRGKRGRGEVPDPKEHVSFDVHEIALADSDSVPWYPLSPPQRITVIWSNVLSVQYEDAVL